MDHPDPTVRKLLDAMALMENRLTEALAGRGGEQTPASSFASLFDSFEGTTSSSTTALQYVDDVFSSSVGAEYAASPFARTRSPSYDDDEPVFDAWPLFDEEPVDSATTQALFSDDANHCFGDELDTDRTMEFRFPTSEFDIKQVMVVVSNTKDSLEFASARRVEIRTRVTVACEDWVVDHNVDAMTVADMAHLAHDYFTLPLEDKPPLGPYIDTAPSPTSFLPQLMETEEEDEVFHTSPSTCSMMVPNRDATTSMLAMVEATWSDEYALVDLQSVCYYSTFNAKPTLNILDEVDPKLLKTFIPLTEQKHLSDVAIDAVIDSASITITHHEALMAKGVIFCSIPKSICEYPDLVRHYLGSIVLPGDNYYAALNSAVFSDGSFCFVPKDTICPMEISTYFRINNKETNQFERTLIVAVERCTYVLLIELCLQVDGVKVRLPPWPPPVWTFWLPYDVCSGMHYNCRDCAWFKGIWQPLFLVTPFYIPQLKLGWDVFLGKEIGEPQGLKWLAVSSGNMAEKMQKEDKYDYFSEFFELAAEFSSSDNGEDGATLLMYKHYAATAISKGIHCLSSRLTDEYSSNAHARNQLLPPELLFLLSDNSLQHYILASDNILAALVVVSSTVRSSSVPEKVVFPIITDTKTSVADLSPLWAINLEGKVNGAVETCRREDNWVMCKRFRTYFNFSHTMIAQRLDPDECDWAYGTNIIDRQFGGRQASGIHTIYG
jgi:Fe-S cluster assembly scaffold protein SufB